MIPTRDSVEKILPGYYDRYDPAKRGNKEQYETLLKNRFQQRRDFMKESDLQQKPELQKHVVDALNLKI